MVLIWYHNVWNNSNRVSWTLPPPFLLFWDTSEALAGIELTQIHLPLPPFQGAQRIRIPFFSYGIYSLHLNDTPLYGFVLSYTYSKTYLVYLQACLCYV